MKLYETMVNAHQSEQELDRFCDLLQKEGVKSYLEIGSKYGGSLWRAGNSLPKGSRIVAVDLPMGTKALGQTERSLKACVLALNDKGYQAKIIWGNSTSEKIIDLVRQSSPFDCVLIDADHTLAGVNADWNNYGPMGRMIAFHDISWNRKPEVDKTPIEVPEFWDRIKGFYRHEEIRLCPSGNKNGIGVLWR